MTRSHELSLEAWSTNAVNLPDHADNPIHTDEGAQAAGFEAAIVAGTTIYAYLTRPAAKAWGEQWLTSGGGELRLRLPVLDNELVECVVEQDPPGITAMADGTERATFELWPLAEAPPMREGETLPVSRFTLEQSQAEYGTRAGDDLALYRALSDAPIDESNSATDTAERSGLVAHPAIWPSLANGIFSTHLVSGAWIHTRSRIFHQGLARVGDDMMIESAVIDRFESRSGERAIVDVAITANGEPVARLEHEALVRLNS